MDISQILLLTGIGFVVTLIIGLFIAHYILCDCTEYEDEDNDCQEYTTFKDEDEPSKRV